MNLISLPKLWINECREETTFYSMWFNSCVIHLSACHSPILCETRCYFYYCLLYVHYITFIIYFCTLALCILLYTGFMSSCRLTNVPTTDTCILLELRSDPFLDMTTWIGVDIYLQDGETQGEGHWIPQILRHVSRVRLPNSWPSQEFDFEFELLFNTFLHCKQFQG